MSSVLNEVEAERSEFEWLLTSGVLGRSQNLAHMLRFICEKQLQGESDQITEHTIALEALGRRSDFDPQTDTIVRVTAHNLRKRLQEIYKREGVSHAIHVEIPAGQYAPSFVHAPVPGQEFPAPPASHIRPHAWWWVSSAVVIALAVASAGYLTHHIRLHTPAAASTRGGDASIATGRPVRALLGENRMPYADHSGFTWLPGNYCSGGTSVSEPLRPIAGTQDPEIFVGGIRGNTHCVFPVEPGIYEIHLLFAELSHLEPATTRSVVFINGSDSNTIDVADDAGGDGIADTKVFTGVRPQNDGAIHVDFISEISVLKAVEILPTPTEAMLPVRIVAGPAPYTDAQGHIWLSDRFFFGGRLGIPLKPGISIQPSLYSQHRVGHFRYVIPVVPGQKYRARLYFQEPWFGKQNGGTGGATSRVFDVWCNGAVLLRNFAILDEAGSAPVVKTFHNIESTAQGKIVFDFVPVVNYPLIDAIEISPEQSAQNGL